MPADRRSGTTTPCAPKPAAERTTAPRLRGSVTPSSATTSGGRPDVGRARQQVVGVGVLVGGHPGRDALVHGAAGRAVELGLRDLEDPDPLLGGGAEHLAEPVVALGPLGDVQRADRDPGAQRLDDRVAPGHPLAVAAAPRRLPARLRVGRRRCAWRPPLASPVGLVVRPVGWPSGSAPCPRARGVPGRPSPPVGLPLRGACGSRPRRLLLPATVSPPPSDQRGPAGGVLDLDAGGLEPVADGVGRRPVLARPGLLPLLAAAPRPARRRCPGRRAAPLPATSAGAAGRGRAGRACGVRRPASRAAPASRRPASSWLPSRTTSCTAASAAGVERSSSMAVDEVGARRRRLAGSTPPVSSVARVTKPSSRRYAAADSASASSENSTTER